MKFSINLIFLMIGNFVFLNAQITKTGYIGLYYSGSIDQYSELVPPHYQKINSSIITLRPKIGYNLSERIALGVVGGYTFAKSTFGDAPSTWNTGYFFDYRFKIKIDSTKKIKRFAFFIEWQQHFYNGYYIRVADYVPMKIYKPMNELNAQVGIEVNLKNRLGASVSYGVGSLNFYKESLKPELGQKRSITPFGILTLLYFIKIKK